MRILDHERGVKKLDSLGLSQDNLDKIRRAIDRPFGLILISGPTGSGKTTTLYSMLNEFDRDHYNVLSLEDPIEYSIEGVNQSQVRADIGYTFANGLRTTLRQDPDIIMVGEIRDEETAGLAIQAALTGHLVLATIHTNSAIGVIPRLIDMKVDPYLIAPTLILTIAQRLVPAMCPGAGEATPVDGAMKMMLDKQFADLPDKFKKKIKFTDTVYKAKATPECPTGTRGRLAVMEALEIDRDLEQLILKNPNEPDIYKMAREKGLLTMKEDAIIKAFDRQIPFQEVYEL
jgi:type IV pilus assembly protein PilB